MGLGSSLKDNSETKLEIFSFFFSVHSINQIYCMSVKMVDSGGSILP